METALLQIGEERIPELHSPRFTRRSLLGPQGEIPRHAEESVLHRIESVAVAVVEPAFEEHVRGESIPAVVPVPDAEACERTVPETGEHYERELVHRVDLEAHAAGAIVNGADHRIGDVGLAADDPFSLVSRELRAHIPDFHGEVGADQFGSRGGVREPRDLLPHPRRIGELPTNGWRTLREADRGNLLAGARAGTHQPLRAQQRSPRHQPEKGGYRMKTAGKAHPRKLASGGAGG